MAYRTNSPPSDAPLTRRTLLQLFGLTGTALLVACGSPTANSTGGAAPAPTTAAPAAVSLPPFKGIPQAAIGGAGPQGRQGQVTLRAQ